MRAIIAVRIAAMRVAQPVRSSLQHPHPFLPFPFLSDIPSLLPPLPHCRYVKPVRENLQRWYENCEMRTVVLSDGGGAGTPDRTWFRGGEAFAEPQKGIIVSHPL